MLDIFYRANQMAFVSHIPIEVVGMPERPGPADLNIGALGGEGLPASDDLAQGKAIQHLDYDVNVVRHEAPSQQSIAFSIEVEQGTLYQRGNLGSS
ncbi:MAG TPA: hypothetical protein VEP47_00325 [Reyranella sp.]|nr:hypothetical protein [Reyranella sp.]